MPTFVYGGDPQFDSLTPDNITQWTGSSGFGWSSGGPVDVRTRPRSSTIRIITGARTRDHKQELCSRFSASRRSRWSIRSEGMRLGFNYTYTDHAGTSRTAQQVIHVSFDPGGTHRGIAAARVPVDRDCR